MINKYVALMLLSPLCASVEIVTGDSFNGKEVLASYDYNARYITAKEMMALVYPNETRTIVGKNFIALSMRKKANAGSVLLQFTCRIEGDGKSEVETANASYLKVDEIDMVMIPTTLKSVDRIVVTGCIVK